MRFFIPLFLAAIIVGCAQVSPLTGGEKDVSAPKIITEKSIPKQGELNYSNQEMTLVFDEYIVLKNPLSNIIITPQPIIPPTISAKNKKFKLLFNEALLTNTTYSISFNGAIADLTEGNDSLFQYVFSTGSFIDSLQFSGSVQHAYTNKPTDKVLIGLYPINDSIPSDSLLYNSKPKYITQTNKAGNFNIKYIKTGVYKAFAYTDNDRNLLYNGATENIAFLDSSSCCLDMLLDSNLFRLFEPKSTKTGLKSSTLNYPGELVLVFHEPQPETISVIHESPLEKQQTGRLDSLVFWLKTPYNNQSGFYITGGNSVDTIRPIMKNLPKNGVVAQLSNINNLHEGKLLPNDTLSLTFNEPIQLRDENMIRLLDKDSNEISFSTFITNIKTLQIIPKNDSVKNISIDSSAIFSTLSNTSNNAIAVRFERHPIDYYGVLIIDLLSDSTSNYILELLNMKGIVIAQKTILKQSKSASFKNLLPGNYQLRLIADLNEDGKWTTGNLAAKKQPEKVYYYTDPIKVRSNWDLEIEWLLSNSKP